MNNISNLLIKIDDLCDYIPVVSTASNLVDLFQKHVISNLMNSETVSNNHYYRCLKYKSTRRSLLLLLPFIGNFFIGIYDFTVNNKKAVLAAVEKNGEAIKHVSERFKDDRDVVFAAVEQNPIAYQYASSELQKDEILKETAMKKALRQLDQLIKEFEKSSSQLDQLIKEFEKSEDIDALLLNNDGEKFKKLSETLKCLSQASQRFSKLRDCFAGMGIKNDRSFKTIATMLKDSGQKLQSMGRLWEQQEKTEG